MRGVLEAGFTFGPLAVVGGQTVLDIARRDLAEAPADGGSGLTDVDGVDLAHPWRMRILGGLGGTLLGGGYPSRIGHTVDVDIGDLDLKGRVPGALGERDMKTDSSWGSDVVTLVIGDELPSTGLSGSSEPDLHTELSRILPDGLETNVVRVAFGITQVRDEHAGAESPFTAAPS